MLIEENEIIDEFLSKSIVADFKFVIADKVWIKDLECFASVLSCWHTRSGLQYELRYFIDGKHETSYFFEDELLAEKP